MKFVNLLTYLKLKSLDNPQTSTDLANTMFDYKSKNNLINNILNNSRPLLNANEFKQIYRKQELDSYNLTSQQADQLLANSTTFITLTGYYNFRNEILQFRSSRTLSLPNENVKVSIAEKLIQNSIILLTKEELFNLLEEAQRKEVDFYAPKVNDQVQMKFTQNALISQQILRFAKVKITKDELKQLIIDSNEVAPSEFPDTDGKIIMKTTQKAEHARYILNYSIVQISSLEEYNSIASMITSSSPVTPAIDIHTINDNNLFAQYILSRDLIFDFGYLKKITTNEIFLGTMDAQNNTTAKIIEEKCRYDYQYGRYMQMLNDKFID